MRIVRVVACVLVTFLTRPSHAQSLRPLLPSVAVARQQVVVSPAVEGVLTSVDVQEGVTVRRGDLLATIDDSVAVAAVIAAEASTQRLGAVARATTDLEAAERQIARITEAHRRQAASDVELDQATTMRNQAAAALSQAREQLAEAKALLALERAKLDLHHIKAPFDGTVLKVSVQPGQSVQRTSPLLTLANHDYLVVELHLPVEWYDRVQIGRACDLLAGVPVEQTVPARLIYREPAVDAATSTFRCRLEIDNRELELPAGFSVQLAADAQRQLARTQPRSRARAATRNARRTQTLPQ